MGSLLHGALPRGVDRPAGGDGPRHGYPGCPTPMHKQKAPPGEDGAYASCGPGASVLAVTLVKSFARYCECEIGNGRLHLMSGLA